MRSSLGQHGIFVSVLLLSLSLALAADGAAILPYYSNWKWQGLTAHTHTVTRAFRRPACTRVH